MIDRTAYPTMGSFYHDLGQPISFYRWLYSRRPAASAARRLQFALSLRFRSIRNMLPTGSDDPDRQ